MWPQREHVPRIFPTDSFPLASNEGFFEQLANCGLAQANSRPRHAPSKVAVPASTLTTFDYRSASAHARKKIHRISTSSTIKHNHLSSCHEKKNPSITTTKQSRNLLCNEANAKLKFALRRRPWWQHSQAEQNPKSIISCLQTGHISTRKERAAWEPRRGAGKWEYSPKLMQIKNGCEAEEWKQSVEYLSGPDKKTFPSGLPQAPPAAHALFKGDFLWTKTFNLLIQKAFSLFVCFEIHYSIFM